MNTRKRLKVLLATRDSYNSQIQSLTNEYTQSLMPNERGIYVTDHAMVRYIERVLGKPLLYGDTDADTLAKSGIVYYGLIDEMLSIEEDRNILNSTKTIYHTTKIIDDRVINISYIIKRLSITTVLVN